MFSYTNLRNNVFIIIPICTTIKLLILYNRVIGLVNIWIYHHQEQNKCIIMYN